MDAGGQPGVPQRRPDLRRLVVPGKHQGPEGGEAGATDGEGAVTPLGQDPVLLLTLQRGEGTGAASEPAGAVTLRARAAIRARTAPPRVRGMRKCPLAPAPVRAQGARSGNELLLPRGVLPVNRARSGTETERAARYRVRLPSAPNLAPARKPPDEGSRSSAIALPPAKIAPASSAPPAKK